MTAPGPGPDCLARGRVDTLADWMHATGHGTHQVLAPAAPIPRGPLPALDHPLPDLHRVHQVIAPAAYLATIPDGLVWGTEGTVITLEGAAAVRGACGVHAESAERAIPVRGR